MPPYYLWRAISYCCRLPASHIMLPPPPLSIFAGGERARDSATACRCRTLWLPYMSPGHAVAARRCSALGAMPLVYAICPCYYEDLILRRPLVCPHYWHWYSLRQPAPMSAITFFCRRLTEERHACPDGHHGWPRPTIAIRRQMPRHPSCHYYCFSLLPLSPWRH